MRLSDWDTYWRWELFRRRCDPLDFRRWKRDSARELRGLHPGAVRLLDSTAGLGDHTVNLAELGFEVEACDQSALARAETARKVAEAGLPVRVFDARWEDLGAQAPGRYDLIFNDALHWTYEPEALEAALRGFLGALAPGGALVFFFADATKPGPGEGLGVLAHDWAATAPERLVWDHRDGVLGVSLVQVCTRGPDYIDQLHLYLVREGDAPARLESLTMRAVYRWDWHALGALLRRVGFVDLETRRFQNVKGRTYPMSFARRPRSLSPP